jgi:hypothetical protein
MATNMLGNFLFNKVRTSGIYNWGNHGFFTNALAGTAAYFGSVGLASGLLGSVAYLPANVAPYITLAMAGVQAVNTVHQAAEHWKKWLNRSRVENELDWMKIRFAQMLLAQQQKGTANVRDLERKREWVKLILERERVYLQMYFNEISLIGPKSPVDSSLAALSLMKDMTRDFGFGNTPRLALQMLPKP